MKERGVNSAVAGASWAEGDVLRERLICAREGAGGGGRSTKRRLHISFRETKSNFIFLEEDGRTKLICFFWNFALKTKIQNILLTEATDVGQL